MKIEEGMTRHAERWFRDWLAADPNNREVRFGRVGRSCRAEAWENGNVVAYAEHELVWSALDILAVNVEARG